MGRQRRVAAGLSAPAAGLLIIYIVAVAVAAFVAVYVMNKDRGVPIAALILVVVNVWGVGHALRYEVLGEKA